MGFVEIRLWSIIIRLLTMLKVEKYQILYGLRKFAGDKGLFVLFEGYWGGIMQPKIISQ